VCCSKITEVLEDIVSCEKEPTSSELEMPNDNVTALVSEESGTTSGLTTASEHLQTADTTISLCEATEIPREGISHGCAVMRDELYSPTTSTLSSTYLTTEVAPLRWFGLLADDADNIFDASIFDAPSFRDMFQGGEHDHYAFTPLGNDHSDRSCVSNPGQSLPPPHNAGPGTFEASHSGASKEPWQVSSILEDHEVPIFRRFVTHLSLWLDLFDPLKHFSTLVSQMAMENAGLMKAILALSARHMSIKLIGTDFHLLDRTVAIRYYYETLQYLQGAMKHESYTQSLELIATAVIVSMYEMIDGAGNGWERHLKGVFWILRQQDVNGESGGLKQAGWWAWLRQDIWAAFRERRRCLSIYKPTRAYAQMDQYDVASRIVYLLSQSVNYSCEDDIKLGERDLQLRIKRGKKLLSMLDEWSGKLPVHFRELPLGQTAFPERVFKPIWIEPSVFGKSFPPIVLAVPAGPTLPLILISCGAANALVRKDPRTGKSTCHGGLP